MRKLDSGFTLIEVVVVIGILAVCSVMLTEMFLGQSRIYRTENAELDITNDARNSLDDIDTYTRQATATLSSYSTYTASSTVLILEIQSVNSSQQLIPGTYDYVVYYLTGTDFYRQVFPDATSARATQTKKLASNVNGLAFTYDNADYSQVTSVSTNITLQENAGIQTRAITASSQSRLRDH